MGIDRLVIDLRVNPLACWLRAVYGSYDACRSIFIIVLFWHQKNYKA